ncbi:mechanosensitive ion channel [Mycolicibacillus parakoreensis]|uniref:Mechanosensitive ion channel family protein n=1 Tax=Mycolicibacillus parakoreensis TaxID=1069221 RepID=A0ABY3U8G4_9MYCO|nr:mechanosensitive ion channel family protein [Mycolicibacillus parakoreensis]MCV7317522.1 mechanosensitive ion channel [Mycolicibacillus parakoreensis]ULN54236.1 mechanosensitive ion channel family protein [Mycolicibacillus parakoreensis]
MNALPQSSWFYWALAVVVGLPLLLVALTELHQALVRRNNVLAKPVNLLRNYLLPLGALLVLLVGANDISPQATVVRVVATVFGFAVLLLLLSAFNITLFQTAPQGSWRRRLPSIFLEVARFVLIAIGVAVILSRVWGANVGGLFAALGVTSIVLGLTLQNSVGQIISGLFVLFEQPFQLGDWIDTPSVKGEVVEVNWRATHIRTAGGLQIMPNSVLAAASFTNLSRPAGAYEITVETTFVADDPPDRVCTVLSTTAAGLPHCRGTALPASVPVGAAGYATTIPLRSPADAGPARATFLRWLWYAARRAGLHLDEAGDDFVTGERVQRALEIMTPTLRLTADDEQGLRDCIRIIRYGAEEIIHSPGHVPEQMSCLFAGRVQLTVTGPTGVSVPVRTLGEGDWLGQTTLTREPVTTTARALTETALIQIERHHLEALVYRKPLLLQDISRSIDDQRDNVKQALGGAANAAPKGVR